jgi:hypothetical protein
MCEGGYDDSGGGGGWGGGGGAIGSAVLVFVMVVVGFVCICDYMRLHHQVKPVRIVVPSM